jgi:hypothetical protein
VQGPALDGVALGGDRKRGGGLGTFWWWHGWSGCEGSAAAAFGSGQWWPQRLVRRWIKIRRRRCHPRRRRSFVVRLCSDLSRDNTASCHPSLWIRDMGEHGWSWTTEGILCPSSSSAHGEDGTGLPKVPLTWVPAVPGSRVIARQKSSYEYSFSHQNCACEHWTVAGKSNIQAVDVLRCDVPWPSCTRIMHIRC